MLRFCCIQLFALFLIAGSAAHGQAASSNPSSHPPVPPSWPLKPGESPPENHPAPPDASERMHQEAVQRANAKRQQQAIADADKLLQLATELKDEVGKLDGNTLSAQSIKKTKEIEKLAKSVRNNLNPVTQ